MIKFPNSRFATIVLIAIFTISLSNCSVRVQTKHNKAAFKTSKRIPPGHAKKIYGDKSAKNHAPGHNKKQS